MIAKGVKSREKTVAIHNWLMNNKTAEEEIERIKIILQDSVTR